MSESSKAGGTLLISDTEFNKLLAEQQTALERTIAHDNERFTSLAVVCLRKGFGEFAVVAAIMDVDYGNHDEKIKAFKAFGSKVALDEDMQDMGLPMAVFNVTEAWIKEVKKEGFDPDRPVSSYPDKEEAYIISGRTFDGRHNMAQYDIVKLDDKKIEIKLRMKAQSPKCGGSDNLLGAFYRGYMETVKGNPPQSKFGIVKKKMN